MNDGERNLNACWYSVPQFAKRGWRWECVVHNRHVGLAFTKRAAQRHAEEQCDDRCMMWGT